VWSGVTIACATTGASCRSRSSGTRHHFIKVTIQVHDYPDGTIALFHVPRRLAGYTVDGALIPEEVQTKSAASNTEHSAVYWRREPDSNPRSRPTASGDT
jgi:hypothetical protein